MFVLYFKVGGFLFLVWTMVSKGRVTCHGRGAMGQRPIGSGRLYYGRGEYSQAIYGYAGSAGRSAYHASVYQYYGSHERGEAGYHPSGR